jgi:hypothetical protein
LHGRPGATGQTGKTDQHEHVPPHSDRRH